jgi:hypothetical protein
MRTGGRFRSIKTFAERKIFVLAIVFNLIFSSVSFSQATPQQVEIVFCMDLSASTNGILDRFRDHLWDYVHLFSNCSPEVDIKIGLVAFARPSYQKENSYVKVLQDLTDDYETFSHRLLQMKPKVENGEQLVGAALKVCSKKISWSKDKSALKVVFLVGNGTTRTGEISCEEAAEELAHKGIIIHSFYCLENEEAYEKRGWERIAEIGNGKFNTLQIKNVYYENFHGFDLDKFRSLNSKLNDTYLFYGKSGRVRWRAQSMEDDYMYAHNTEGFRYRVAFKISDLFQQKNDEWDLVDLYTKDQSLIYKQDKMSMPDTMKNMSTEDLRAFIVFNKYQRKLLIKKINKMLEEKELSDKDRGFVMKKRMNTLDILSIELLKELLVQKGFDFVEPFSAQLKN